ncbi:hypothetical protein [Clostridium guangxiense]|uniref:hypothetical protein n=1 Tax=Clostridium guangxiense TaxID=1662055 RepID=UPI001E49C8E8|nr:hypothetical protein [Clostridium guangxiense]MCD2347243.1 hypothetical protein [Clostridium guangxiense]
MFYDKILRKWIESDNVEDLLNKFLPKFVYCSLRLDNINTTFENIKINKVDKAVKSYMDFCSSVLKLDSNIEVNANDALQSVSRFYCSSYYFLGGRISRMLVNHALIANNLPPIIFFYNDKEEHDLSLHNIEKMVGFLDKQAYKTWVKDYNMKSKTLNYFLDK